MSKKRPDRGCNGGAFLHVLDFCLPVCSDLGEAKAPGKVGINIMTFTAAEKLQIAMLCDLAKPPKERELDLDFIHQAVMDNDSWALHWKYPGLQLNVETPKEVLLVCDILDMWECLEASFDALDTAEKARVQKESYNSTPPRFAGFDGNNESKEMHIARLLVHKLDRWSRFDGRDLNSHFPSLDAHHRLLVVWKPIWDAKLKKMTGGHYLAPDDLIKILSEYIHPDHRQHLRGGIDAEL